MQPWRCMGCKILCLAIISVLFSCLYCAERPTIIDTIYTENSLQALVSLRMETNEYHAEVLPSFNQYIYPGDFPVSGWETGDPTTNLGFRFYLSFPIQPLPSDYTIENVRIMLFQFYCHGDGGDNNFPSFYGVHYDLMVDHVNYGNSIDISDFNPLNYGTVGAISTDNTYGWKILDVTDEYIVDLNQNRQYIQLMIYFPIISDWDFCADCVNFRSSHHISPDGKPQIVITYRSTSSSDDEVAVPYPDVVLYPNPCKNYVSICAKEDAILIQADLFNLKGQSIKTISTSKNTHQEISLESEPGIRPGIYLLRYEANSLGKKYVGTRKLVIR